MNWRLWLLHTLVENIDNRRSYIIDKQLEKRHKNYIASGWVCDESWPHGQCCYRFDWFDWGFYDAQIIRFYDARETLRKLPSKTDRENRYRGLKEHVLIFGAVIAVAVVLAMILSA